MQEFRRWAVLVPGIALLVLLVLLVMNRSAVDELASMRQGHLADSSVVDQRPFETSRTLADLAVSAEEQAFAQQAQRLADHEVDQAFAAALRQAETQQKVLTGEAAEIASRVDELKGLVKGDQETVDSLTAKAKAAGGTSAPGDDLDVAQAQLGLDQDELADAQADLARASGDKRPQIQQELSAREVTLKKGEDGTGKKPTAVVAVRRFGTLLGRIEGWFAQRSRAALLAQAESQATADAKKLAQQHDALEGTNAGRKSAADVLSGADRVKALKALGSRRVLMSILDDRAQTEKQLASVYREWQAQVWVQHRIVGYLILQSFAAIALIVLLAATGAVLGRMAVGRTMHEPRRRRTLETIVMLAAELFGIVGVAIVLFGLPQQTPTIVGFATAAITVVFQDFILGFFGWFSLMGRHGIRVGDWVEINSVSGEVAEISLFRTVLLETGNWTTKGHPTGRRMSFSNSFALKGQYFNFSTNGQWMWDEITLNVPATVDAYELIKQMQAAVDRETDTDTTQAELEWQRVAKDIGVGQFNAKPMVEMHPAATGVDVVVRFVTQASDRFTMRNKVNSAMLELMAGTERPAGAQGSTA